MDEKNLKEITNLKSEIKAVKQIGDEIGYGNLMSIASALWRKRLREMGYPESGAFVPAIQMEQTSDEKLYDEFIEKLDK